MIAKQSESLYGFGGLRLLLPAKAGILGLTLDLAFELASFKNCVNVILPEAVPFPSNLAEEDGYCGLVRGQERKGNL